MVASKAAYNIVNVIPMSSPKVTLVRIEPTDLAITLREIYNSLANLCWINNLPNVSRVFKKSLQARATGTVEVLKNELVLNPDSSLSSSAGEYVVSELAHSTVVNELNYLDIPLGELIKQKVKGNPGFDFFSVNPTTMVLLFGEAKYKARANAYDSAFAQIVRFVEQEEKDIKDMADLEHLCPAGAQDKVADGIKGYMAAFSSTSMSDKVLKDHIEKHADFQKLLKYEELVCVAVNLS